MNPRIEVAITRTFEAQHSLPRVGAAQSHKHTYTLECGCFPEIDPDLGCARPMQELTRDLDAVLAMIEGKSLNDVLPVPPTAEMLACWILAQLSPYWDWVSLRAYDGFMCKVERRHVLPLLENMRARPTRTASDSKS